ncbi:MAG: MATE family efflux transporter [Oscillospiraceae bacterium]|jgi:putative MATE family efflux protein|nr:MATE family efflux transporter [Oscillospiraceae bacterium]
MKNFTRDLTEGNVAKQLIGFSAPFFAANFMQALYGITDRIIVGNFVDTGESSLGTDALYVSWAIMMFMNAVIIGLTVGVTVIIAQCVGAKRLDRLKDIIGTTFSAFGIIAVVLSALLFAFAPALLKVLQTPEAAFEGAKAYLRINAAGFVFVAGYNSVSATLRGMGDSMRPMVFVAIAASLNIFLDLLFIGALGWGLAGAGFATIISQAASFTLAVVYLSKSGFVFDFKPGSFKIKRAELNNIVRLGLPSAVQQSLVQGSFLAITPLANSIGASSIAAVMGAINGLAILPAQAMMAAVSSMTGQNIGAGKIDRAKKIMRSAMLLILPVSLAVWAAVFFFPETLMGVFTNYEGNAGTGANYLRIGCTEYIIVSELFMINGLILGAGHPKITLINSFVNSILMRVPLAYLFALGLGFGVYGIPMATAIAPVGGILIAWGFYMSGKWKTGLN